MSSNSFSSRKTTGFDGMEEKLAGSMDWRGGDCVAAFEERSGTEQHQETTDIPGEDHLFGFEKIIKIQKSRLDPFPNFDGTEGKLAGSMGWRGGDCVTAFEEGSGTEQHQETADIPSED